MTKIKFTKNQSGEITAFTADGHTNYGVEGEDIVCAAVSGVIQTAALGILMVAETQAEIVRKDAYFELTLPAEMTPTQRRDCNIILKTMMVGLNDIRETYSDFLEIS